MIDIIEYKNYLGKVEVDFDDDCIYVSVSNAPGLNLIAEGSTPGEAELAFRSILDDYLESAKEMDWEIIGPIVKNERQPDTDHEIQLKPVSITAPKMAGEKREPALAHS